jgi:hypothetical protein
MLIMIPASAPKARKFLEDGLKFFFVGLEAPPDYKPSVGFTAGRLSREDNCALPVATRTRR